MNRHGGQPPIPDDSRTLRVMRRRHEHAEMIQTAHRIATEVGLDTPTVITIASKLPGDPISLRGIPAIGRGITGAIHQTKPGHGL